MEATIVLAFLFGFPLVVGALFRVNTSYLFVTILAAELIERYFRDDAELVLAPFIQSEVVLQYLGFAMLVLPVILTGVFLHGSLSKAKTFLQIIPLVLCGVVFAAFAAPILPTVIREALIENQIGSLLIDSAQLIVGTTVFLQLMALWSFNKPKHGSKKHA